MRALCVVFVCLGLSSYLGSPSAATENCNVGDKAQSCGNANGESGHGDGAQKNGIALAQQVSRLHSFSQASALLALLKVKAENIPKCSTDIAKLFSEANPASAITLNCDCPKAVARAKDTREGDDGRAEFVEKKYLETIGFLNQCLNSDLEKIQRYSRILLANAGSSLPVLVPMSPVLNITAVRAGDLRFKDHHCSGQVPLNWIRAQCHYSKPSDAQPPKLVRDQSVLACQIDSSNTTITKVCGGKDPSPEGERKIEISYNCGGAQFEVLEIAAGGDVAIVCPLN